MPLYIHFLLFHHGRRDISNYLLRSLELKKRDCRGSTLHTIYLVHMRDAGLNDSLRRTAHDGKIVGAVVEIVKEAGLAIVVPINNMQV